MIDEKIIKNAEESLKKQFDILDEIALYNSEKVLNAFKKNKIALRHFNGTTGYGYGDEGRDALNNLCRDIFKSESAICSPHILSGTHALNLCLQGVLRPNDIALSITGKPYDTLIDCLYGENNGSLKDFNIKFELLPYKDCKFDKEGIKNFLKNNKVKMIYMQRSRGYEWRNSLSISEIEDIVKFLKEIGFDGIIMLDNCYGEFVEKREATEVGVNLLAGSMIKNFGGGISPNGGYIAGDKKYIDLILKRMTAPSIGGEVGSYAYGYGQIFQGIFLAPHTVREALKGSMLYGKVLNDLGYETSPKSGEIPSDITRMIKFNDKDLLINFIQNIQDNSPIDSFVKLYPWDMPGYTDQVIMAAGCFIQGSSIELSADAPIKPPYICYMQGGLTYEHCKIALKNLKI